MAYEGNGNQRESVFDASGLSAGIEDMIAPLREAILADDYPGLNLGSSGAVYDRTRAEKRLCVLCEAGALLEVCPDDPLRAAYVEKVIAGTDPEHAFYWGRITDYDQYIVEAAALSLTLLLQRTLLDSVAAEEPAKASGLAFPNTWV